MSDEPGAAAGPSDDSQPEDAALDAWCRGKVAIVTGAARGIGRALVEQLLSHGAHGVTLIDRDEDGLTATAVELGEAASAGVLPLAVDVTDPVALLNAVQATIEMFGRIDLLINNAGAPFVGAFDDLGDNDWTDAFALNFHGPMNGVRAVLPAMHRQGGGTIVNVISGMAFMPMAFQSMYAATKAALNAATLALRSEFWDEGIRMISATPGTTATEIWGARGSAPPSAQRPSASARTILLGVARNDRLVLGDEPDRRGAKRAFDPDVAPSVDAFLLEIARARRRGISEI